MTTRNELVITELSEESQIRNPGNFHLHLLFINEKGVVRPAHMIDEFKSMTAKSVCSRLSELRTKYDLVCKGPDGYGLSELGKKRLLYYEKERCSDSWCPRCFGRTNTSMKCFKCGVWHARETLEANESHIREIGAVYCSDCGFKMFRAMTAKFILTAMEPVKVILNTDRKGMKLK